MLAELCAHGDFDARLGIFKESLNTGTVILFNIKKNQLLTCFFFLHKGRLELFYPDQK
jgi:hypothetical protein